VARLFIAFWLAIASGAALDLAALKPKGHLSDFSGHVDVETRGEIETYCRLVKQGTGAEIAIVLLPTLDGEPIEDVANSLYRRWGIGQKGKNEGVLFLLAVRDRKTRLEVGYGLEGVFPDGYAGGLLREIRPLLRENQYGPAMAKVARTLGERIAKEKGVTIPALLERRPSRGPQGDGGIPLPLIILGVVILLFLLSGMGGGGRGGRRRRYGGGPVFMPFPMGGGGSSGGGGFGGYDSSDSFGGFGGGDSGGGGASGDW
jgi:uncharacterized protein